MVRFEVYSVDVCRFIMIKKKQIKLFTETTILQHLHALTFSPEVVLNSTIWHFSVSTSTLLGLAQSSAHWPLGVTQPPDLKRNWMDWDIFRNRADGFLSSTKYGLFIILFPVDIDLIWSSGLAALDNDIVLPLLSLSGTMPASDI